MFQMFSLLLLLLLLLYYNFYYYYYMSVSVCSNSCTAVSPM